jgi:hypothetical protein
MVKSNNDPAVTRESPVMLELLRLDTGSAVALVGHPIHVMMVHFPIAFVIATLGVDFFYWWSGDAFWVRVGLWAAGFTFLTGVAASIVGTAELLLVPDTGRNHGGELGTASVLPGIDPAAWPRALGCRLGDGGFRRLAWRQARV